MHVYGDFNLPKVDWSTGLAESDCTAVRDKVQCLKNFIYFNGLHQHNTINNCAGNVLDLIISNVPVFDVREARETLVPVDLFHPPFTLSFFISFQLLRELSIPKFIYTRGDYLGLCNHLRGYDWSCLYHLRNVNSCVELLTSTVQRAMEEFIPKEC